MFTNKQIGVMMLMVAGLCKPAQASLVLSFEDAGASSTVVIVDNQPNGYVYDGTNASNENDANWTGPNFANGLVGIIETPVGLQVGNFTVTFGAGFGSDPSNLTGLQDLNLAVTSTGAGTLQVKLTQTDYVSYPVDKLYSHIGGTLDNGMTLSYTAGMDPASGYFGLPGATSSTAFTTSNISYDDSQVITFSQVSSFSLTQAFTITATAAGQTLAFDAELSDRQNVIPEPASGAMFVIVGATVFGMVRASRSCREAN